MGVHHVAIKALDILATVAFYVEVLGLTETHRNVDDRGLRSVWLRCGEAIVMIERSDTGGKVPTRAFGDDPPGLHMLALSIPADAREAWSAKISEMGHRIVHETQYTLYVQDPEGNRVALSTWPTASKVP